MHALQLSIAAENELGRQNASEGVFYVDNNATIC
jgi:hypothetical protein